MRGIEQVAFDVRSTVGGEESLGCFSLTVTHGLSKGLESFEAFVLERCEVLGRRKARRALHLCSLVFAA